MANSKRKMVNDVLTEKDFYPPSDDREYISCVDDVEEGDNFYDYAGWFYNEYGDDLFDDWRL